jgi:hypothetical protein
LSPKCATYLAYLITLNMLATCLLAGFLLNLFLRPWRWRRYVPPKRRLTLNGLHGAISQKLILFITTAVKTSKLAWSFHLYLARGTCYEVPHYTIISSPLSPDVFLSTLFSQTLSLCSSFNTTDQFSHPYETSGEIIVLPHHTT